MHVQVNGKWYLKEVKQEKPAQLNAFEKLRAAKQEQKWVQLCGTVQQCRIYTQRTAAILHLHLQLAIILYSLFVTELLMIDLGLTMKYWQFIESLPRPQPHIT